MGGSTTSGNTHLHRSGCVGRCDNFATMRRTKIFRADWVGNLDPHDCVELVCFLTAFAVAHSQPHASAVPIFRNDPLEVNNSPAISLRVRWRFTGSTWPLPSSSSTVEGNCGVRCG